VINLADIELRERIIRLEAPFQVLSNEGNGRNRCVDLLEMSKSGVFMEYVQLSRELRARMRVQR